MSKFKTQIGESYGADFEEKTWTFLMPDNFEVKSGVFALVPIEEYNKLIS